MRDKLLSQAFLSKDKTNLKKFYWGLAKEKLSLLMKIKCNNCSKMMNQILTFLIKLSKNFKLKDNLIF